MKIQRNILTGVCAIGLATCLTSCVFETPEPVHHHTATVYNPGYSVTTLPSGYQTVTYRGSKYFTHDGIYYQTQGTGYVVVRSPY